MYYLDVFPPALNTLTWTSDLHIYCNLDTLELIDMAWPLEPLL
jgi:hypothetical protein